jgi:hypothetical protein
MSQKRGVIIFIDNIHDYRGKRFLMRLYQKSYSENLNYRHQKEEVKYQLAYGIHIVVSKEDSSEKR